MLSFFGGAVLLLNKFEVCMVAYDVKECILVFQYILILSSILFFLKYDLK